MYFIRIAGSMPAAFSGDPAVSRMIFSSIVPPSCPAGTAVADYLAARFTYLDRNAWIAHLRAGKITRNGVPCGESSSVAPGDPIAYDAREFEEPEADLSYRIVYEDDWLLGIDKPGNLLVHRAGRSFRNNLIYHLRSVHSPAYPLAHPAHRLDRSTSGVLLVAKEGETRALLGRAWSGGNVVKIYTAVVRGRVERGDIDLPIAKRAEPGNTVSFVVDKDGKPSLTRILGCEPVGPDHSLVTAQPLTGRTHQIRIHLATAGAPIVGDRLYGRVDFTRHALHCRSLQFTHPHTGKQCLIQAGLPRDLRDLIRHLAGNT